MEGREGRKEGGREEEAKGSSGLVPAAYSGQEYAKHPVVLAPCKFQWDLPVGTSP